MLLSGLLAAAERGLAPGGSSLHALQVNIRTAGNVCPSQCSDLKNFVPTISLRLGISVATAGQVTLGRAAARYKVSILLFGKLTAVAIAWEDGVGGDVGRGGTSGAVLCHSPRPWTRN